LKSFQVPEKYDEAIVKCDDSVRGYALRLNNPKGGYTWIGMLLSNCYVAPTK